MRLPGTIAWPWKAGRAPTELTEFIQPGPDDKRPGQLLTRDVLLAQLPEAGAGKQKEADGEPFDFGIPGAGLSTVSRLIAAIKSGNHNWHNAMIRLVAHWVGQGRSSMEILGHAADWTLAGYTVQQTHAEVSKAIEGARTRWGVPDTDPNVAKEPSTPFGEALFDPRGRTQGAPIPHRCPAGCAARLRRRARPHHGRRSLRARLGRVVSLQRRAGRTSPACG